MRKMSILKLSLLFAVLLSVPFFTSCGDDENEKSQYVGSYVITKATLVSPVEIPYVVGDVEDTLTIPPGIPFTEMIQNALLGVIEDCSEDASYLELKEDNSMYLTCGTTGWTLHAGIWKEEEDGTVIIMIFNQDAIPSAPGGFQLKTTNVELKNGIMSSTTEKIPFPKETGAKIIAGAVERGHLPEGAVLAEDAPQIFWFSFDMEFKKVK